MDNKDLKALLREASMVPGVNVPREEIPEDKMQILESITEHNIENKWELIKATMEDEFATRFLQEMRGLSGREFIRVYLKMLEYIKPKIIRVEKDKEEEEENVLRIEVYNSPTQLQLEGTIDITPEEDGTE